MCRWITPSAVLTCSLRTSCPLSVTMGHASRGPLPVPQDSVGNDVNAEERPELRGLVLRAAVTPKPRDGQQRYEFVALITSEGTFHFKDVAVVAVYGWSYRLNFTLSTLPSIAVCVSCLMRLCPSTCSVVCWCVVSMWRVGVVCFGVVCWFGLSVWCVGVV